MHQSNAGKWNRWYAMLGQEPEPYAATKTYEIGARWLGTCETVEDWGCGKGWLTTLIEPGRYRGIDGSESPFADEVVDLVSYRSEVPGIFMRHVIEHDFRWAQILDNALASFTQRMVLILFTPLGDRTRDIEWEKDPGVPNISFKLVDITDRIDAANATWAVQTIESPSKFGVETIIQIGRKDTP